MIIVVDFLFLFSGMFAHYMTMKQDRNTFCRVFWAAMGFYIGPLALPLVYLYLKITNPLALYKYE